MPEIDGMSKETLRTFLVGMRIVDVWYYEDPQAIHLLIGEERGAPTALLEVTASPLDDGVLNISLAGAGVARDREGAR